MKYPTYEQYKDSGIEWLGEVPSHWNVKRLRFTCTTNPVKSELKDMEGHDLVSFVPMEDIGECGGMNLEKEKELDSVYNGYTYFAENDVVVAKITPCFENGKGAIAQGLRNGVAFGTTELHVMRPLEGYSNRYLFYLSISHPFREIGKSEMLGAGGQKRVPENFLKDFKTAFPEFPEQVKIADFIDRKTTQIDRLIEKKQALIEKLNDKRSTLITRAVTKGLDENVPMKDSRVEWLGKVPAHWEVKMTKYFTKILRGQFSHRPRNDPNFYDGEYPFIQTGDVSNARKYIEDYTQTLNEKGYAVSKEFPAGTLVMTIAANIGDMAILNFDACFPDSIVGFVPEEDVDLGYLFYLFVAMKTELMNTAVLNTQLNLNIMRIASMTAVCPPLEEQRKIAVFLEKEISYQDGLYDKIKNAIEQLNEYRTALITAAVTGKIDTRNFKLCRKHKPSKEAA